MLMLLVSLLQICRDVLHAMSSQEPMHMTAILKHECTACKRGPGRRATILLLPAGMATVKSCC